MKYAKLLLAALLAAAMAACGSGTKDNGAEESAAPSETAETQEAPAAEEKDTGTYNIKGISLDGYIVEVEEMKGEYIEFEENGGGYLYFGDDNKGPISEWSNENGTFSMKAGISDFTGDMKDGILMLDFGDDIIACFAKDSADLSGLKIITLDEYKKIAKETAGGTAAVKDESLAGTYTLYAAEGAGYLFQVPTEGEDMTFEQITLNEDGSGLVTVDTETENITWASENGALELIEPDGSSTKGRYDITIGDGFIIWVVPADGETPEIKEYFAREDADVESLGAMTYEEFLEAN